MLPALCFSCLQFTPITKSSTLREALGFAYSTYGDETLKVEVEPGISRNPNNKCDETKTCPAPMYFLNGEYLGKYSNIPEVSAVTVLEEDFGLDVYEPLFFHPIAEWASQGNFSVKLRFDDEDLGVDLFYFCHIHEFMVGRIKLTKNGIPINDLGIPSLGFFPDQTSEFDKLCGTFGLNEFQLPNRLCPDRFVCGIGEGEDQSDDLKLYAKCNDAMNCHMLRYVHR